MAEKEYSLKLLVLFVSKVKLSVERKKYIIAVTVRISNLGEERTG